MTNWSCSVDSTTTQFSIVAPEQSGVIFSNDLSYTEDFNPYTYRNFCNGGGVAIGDINGDDLLDIYLAGNQVDNRLYLNKGNFEWEDITESAGVACRNVWSSGVSMIDINGDGLLDIYVCKAGKPGGERRYNELFINNGDLTFTESAKAYGLDIVGLSIHAAFFDYDKDGDLDCYILNNSIRSVGGFDLSADLREVPSNEGNKLLRNDDGQFVDVSRESGIYTSAIGYGLGITLSDFDGDSWSDIFISNDFFERDYLYINQQDGTFKEKGADCMMSMSMGSMGADAADINNDMHPDLFVTEMLPFDYRRRKTKTQYETWNKYQQNIKTGYHHQFARNALHLNTKEGQFLEVGRAANVAATDWSWASLVQDFDNDGYKDIYISNGIYKDLLDKDYLNYYASDTKVKQMIQSEEKVITKLVEKMPSSPLANHMYKNTSADGFVLVSDQWGLGQATYSNGSAYGDLDNDGDLDLVVNNVDQPAGIYKNNTDTAVQRFAQIDLQGKGKNTAAIGATVQVYYDGGQAMVENYTSRGFQSTVASVLHVGVGGAEVLDSVVVIWPSGERSLHTSLQTNRRYQFEEADITTSGELQSEPQAKQTEACRNLPFLHKELPRNQFAKEPMMTKMTAHHGPGLAVADINGDGLEDIFVGGGKNQSSSLLMASRVGEDIVYTPSNQSFDQYRKSEVTDAVFFDCDNDGDLDLYMAHGGKLFSAFVPELDDVLLINDGQGYFAELDKPITFLYAISTTAAVVLDVNGDGYQDIVIGEGGKTKLYGLPGSCHIVMSKGSGQYEVVSPTAMKDIGIVTSLAVANVTGGTVPDIVVAGEWMPITIYSKTADGYKTTVVPNSSGLWSSLAAIDVDQDGDTDIVAGNQGENSFITAGTRMYVADFDQNGSQEQIIAEQIAGKYFPMNDIDELYSQLPMLKKKFRLYEACAAADMEAMFGAETVASAKQMTLQEVRSVALINDQGSLEKMPLDKTLQYSSIHAIAGTDKLQQDGQSVLLGGNDYNVKPQFGRLDASYGWVAPQLISDDKTALPLVSLGIHGQIRNIAVANGAAVIALNNDSLKICNITYE